MNKESFLWVLESALLSFDKMPEQEILELVLDKRCVKMGIKLAGQLEAIK